MDKKSTMASTKDITNASSNTPSPQFSEVVTMIQTAKQKVFAAVNTTLIDLYWQIGCFISRQVEKSGWGKSVVEELADYIRTQEPNSEGFSKQNLWRMKQFYETYKDAPEILSTLAREISWTNNTIIFSSCKTAEEREFYLRMCQRERYSKRELERQIGSALYERYATNQIKLSPLVREIAPKAEHVFRDHYVMEFVGEQNGKPENILRKTLIAKMRDFILELGKDFIHIKDEYHLQVGNSDFRIDLLFYHRELQCLVAFELKTEKFKPEHLGQLNFYLEALDRDVKKPFENPSIGVLLCKSKDDEVVEYALSRSLSPTMVAEYELKLPNKALLQRKMQELAELMDEQA
ncbi:MAG: PDDEXK nuclease domain-containing protein [Bacteroidales bacterium]|nr:PDDEXK nuclease domain-containing protein [Bacteroidales bacterium]